MFQRLECHRILFNLVVLFAWVTPSCSFKPPSPRGFWTCASSSSSICSMPQQMSRDDDNDNDWSPLNPESLVSAKCLIEQTLCVASDDRPQLAKNVDYASSILEAWNDEQEDDDQSQVEYKPVAYQDDDGVSLRGYLVRKRRYSGIQKVVTEEIKSSESSDDAFSPSPAVIFFHTAAGPHDLFLLWKAASLVCSPQLDALDCHVLIADVLGDDSGWAWDTSDKSRTRYTDVRNELLQEKCNDGYYYRPVLRQRLQAAIHFVSALEDVDSTRLAGFGWCLGGQAILELGRMPQLPNNSKMLAMATFHGVFSGATVSTAADDDDDDATLGSQAEVLICHGVNDPFVSDRDLESAMAIFQSMRHRLSLLRLPTKHGFTNPAQAFNDNPAFAYHKDAADKAWRQALAMLQRNLKRQ